LRKSIVEVEQAIENWLESSDYDLETAARMLDTGRYVYVVFMCHLALEKALKAIVCAETRKMPLKTHDLLNLLKKGKVKMEGEMLDFLGKINGASVVTRYPDSFSKILSAYPKDVARKYLDDTRKVLIWLRQDPRLRE